MKVKFVRLRKISGPQMRICYDVNAPNNNNYVANRFVVHNSRGITKMCKDVKVSGFDDIVAINAMYRPGPLRAGISAKYADRKNGEEEIDKQHPIVDGITKQTLGLIIYQEQVMRILNELAGMPMSDVQAVRKLIQKSRGKESVEVYRKQFVRGVVKNGVKKDKANELFDQLNHFGCMPSSTRVKCIDGDKPVCDIREGVREGKEEHVLSYNMDTGDSMWNKVSCVMDTGVQSCKRIKVNGAWTSLSEDEFVMTLCGLRRVGELIVGDKLICP